MTHTLDLLGKAFDDAGCDKSSRHQYHRVYYHILKTLMNTAKPHRRPVRILEIGIFKGDSLKAWIDFFENHAKYPAYEIVGLDIFVRIPSEEIEVLDHEKVRWYEQDSTKGVPDWDDIGQFDLIIDDGLHTPRAQVLTFENYYPFLRKGGSYIIEDVWPLHLMNPREKQHKWIMKHPQDYTDILHNDLMKTITDRGDYIMEHDHRKLTGNADSFLLEILKET